MPYSTFLGINTALRGLMAQQVSLDTTAHNIGNINTEGYSRQRAELVAELPLSTAAFNAVSPAQVGTGVMVAGFERMRDTYLDRTLRTELGRFGSGSTSLGQLQQLEGVIGEPSDHALAATMQRFFAALDQVAANPDSTAARQSFAQMADELATRFNQLATDVASIRQQSDDRLNAQVTDINSITTRIAELNTNIRDAVITGQDPNDLRDERDRLMDQLAGKINYTYTTSANDEVTITFPGAPAPFNIVDPTVPPGFTAITRLDLDNAYPPAGLGGTLTSGEVFADLELFNTTIPAYQTQLDNLASSIVQRFNAMNAAGFDLNGVAGGDIFEPGALTAATMSLLLVPPAAANILTDPRLIAAASSWAPPGEPGNGDNAIAMLNERNVVQLVPVALGATWEDYYNALVTDLGTRSQQGAQTVANLGAVVDSLVRRKSEVSGVSMDEEMSNMLKFQHAYNASARLMTAFDEVLDTLINRTGRVGL